MHSCCILAANATRKGGAAGHGRAICRGGWPRPGPLQGRQAAAKVPCTGGGRLRLVVGRRLQGATPTTKATASRVNGIGRRGGCRRAWAVVAYGGVTTAV
ncbi:hypothetical protein GW17_00057031 [Ensete ventricosum]|nr:hypothetical protein GW17_00057031 [Ensete ventricosum]